MGVVQSAHATVRAPSFMVVATTVHTCVHAACTSLVYRSPRPFSSVLSSAWPTTSSAKPRRHNNVSSNCNVLSIVINNNGQTEQCGCDTRCNMSSASNALCASP